MAKRKNCPEDFKRDAVDLVRSSKDRTLTDIARSLGIHLETRRLSSAVDDTVIRPRFVDEHRNAHTVKRMCDALGWDRSSYYAWHQNKEAAGTGRRGRDSDPPYPGGSTPIRGELTGWAAASSRVVRLVGL